MTEIGSISLDLIIQNTIEAQLNSIASKARKPAEKFSETLSDAVSDIKIPDKIELPEVKISEPERSIDEIVSEALERVKMPEIKPEIKVPEQPEVKIKPFIEYDTAKINQEIDDICRKLSEPVDELTQEIREKLGTFDISDDPAEALEQELSNAYFKLELLQKKWQELQAIPDPTDKICSQLQSVQQQIISANKAIDRLETKLGNIRKPQVMAAEQPALDLEAEKHEESEKSSVSAFKRIASAASRSGMTVSKALCGAFKSVKNAGSKAFDGIKKGLGKLTSPVRKFGQNFKRAFKSVFLMTGIYGAFRAVKDGLLQAAKADEKFSDSLNSVKANLSIAFMPIIQSVMPMLNALMSGLAVVTRSIAGFISGIFGKTYQQSAEAAKKLQSVSKEAKKARLSMAGIDEMNILSSGDDDEEGIDYSKIDMTEPELPDWAERLKDAIRSGDWSGVGSILAQKVNDAFSAINWGFVGSKIGSGINAAVSAVDAFISGIDWKKRAENFADLFNGIFLTIDFDAIGGLLSDGLNGVFQAIYTFLDKVNWTKITKKLTSGLNTFIRKTDWGLIGRTFGKGLNTINDVLLTFSSTFDWKGAGQAFSDVINSFFAETDFAKAGRALSESLKGLLDFLIVTIEKIDWWQVGKKIAELIENIDWNGISDRFFELLGAAFGAISATFWGFIDDAVTAIGNYFAKEIEECGGNVFAGLCSGIINGFKTIGQWIKDHIFKPFMEGFKKAFGIASPSKEMAKMGVFIVDGLYNAISDDIERIRLIFTKMREKIESVFDRSDSWFGEKFDSARRLVEVSFTGIGDWFKQRYIDIKGAFSGVGDWFKEKFSKAREETESPFSGIGDWFGKRCADIKSAFSGVGDWFRDKFRGAYNNVTSVWDGLKGYFSGLWSDISSGAAVGVNWIIDRLNGMIDAVEGMLNRIIDGINCLSFDVPDWLSEKFGIESFGFNIPNVYLPWIPGIPALANGGIVSEPTLAMIGDNRNARTDPEVVAPLSKLQEIGGNGEIIALLNIIIDLLKSGMNVEIVNYLFRDSEELRRIILKIIRDDRDRGGV